MILKYKGFREIQMFFEKEIKKGQSFQSDCPFLVCIKIDIL